jgi:hypothetical protein
MNIKSIMVLGILAAFVTPSLAATEYFVAQDAKTKKCSVVEKKPDGKVMMEIGKASYKTQAEADAAMKAATECKTK